MCSLMATFSTGSTGPWGASRAMLSSPTLTQASPTSLTSDPVTMATLATALVTRSRWWDARCSRALEVCNKSLMPSVASSDISGLVAMVAIFAIKSLWQSCEMTADRDLSDWIKVANSNFLSVSLKCKTQQQYNYFRIIYLETRAGRNRVMLPE